MPAGCKALCALQARWKPAIPPAPGILSRTKKSSPAGCIVLYLGYIAATSPTDPHSTTNHHGCNTGAPSLLILQNILPLIIYVNCLFTTMTTFIPAQILVALCVVGSAVAAPQLSLGRSRSVLSSAGTNVNENQVGQVFSAFLFTFFLGCHKRDNQPDAIHRKSS